MSGHGHFHWNELNTRKVEQAKRFYEDTIGWTFSGMPMNKAETLYDAPGGTYWVAMQGERPVGGIFDTSHLPGEIPEHWLPYTAVDDVDERCAKARRAGATIMREPFDVPGVGRLAILKQPGGGMVGWMTPAPMPDA